MGQRIFALVLCMAIVPLVALSGCLTNQSVPTGPSYSNDIVTIESYYVSNLNPYSGSPLSVDFLLQNNGEFPVSHLSLDVIAPSGMTNSLELTCQGIASTDIEGGKRCEYNYANINDAIQPFDIRSVSISMQTPSGILKPTSFSLRYSVSYDYMGYRKADLPIVDGTTLLKATSAYSESSPSYGPIRLDFSVPARAEYVEGKQVIKQYWGVKGEPLEVTFDFTDVASSDYKDGSASLSAYSVTLDTKGSLQKVDKLPCNFCKAGDQQCPAVGATYVSSTALSKLPGKMRCSFAASTFTEPQIFATLWASYTYKYSYSKTQAFEVQPLNENQ
ncbi:MAG: hypothetical protein NT016_00140 [Candidatus Aenigmarchaeota archaeon]|nr:hypothetical protein [Candidatus Aenigmarchaeota archaeon]